MKLPTQTNKVRVTSNKSQRMSLDSQNISIVENFLRNKIYSNKPLAVVREYFANAVDEHKKFDVKNPIEINITDDTFSVRDFAKGLPEDDVFGIYFNYCASTKSNSNDGIGGFGIGSKAGHAYTDRFFVHSFHSGHKSSYAGVLQSKDGKTEGRAHLMGRINEGSFKDFQTGIQVDVPILSTDKIRFIVYASVLATFSSLKVTINGHEVPKAKDKTTFNSEDDSWFISLDWRKQLLSFIEDKFNLPENRTRYIVHEILRDNEPIITVGGIPYPVKIDHLNYSTRQLVSPNLCLGAKIADVEISLSRETIEYTKKTNAFIQDVIDEQIKQSAKVYVDKLSKLDDYWEIYDAFNSIPYGFRNRVEFQKYYQLTQNYARFNSCREDGKARRGYGGFALSKKDVVYHAFSKIEKVPRGFWQVDEHKKGRVFIQYWENKEAFEKAKKEHKFWKLKLPSYQLRILSEFVVPKDIVEAQKQKRTYKKTDFLKTFVFINNWTRSANGSDFSIRKAIQRIDTGANEKRFKAGGFYIEAEHGTVDLEEYIRNVLNGSDFPINRVFSAETLINLSSTHNIVGVMKTSIPKFEKDKNWEPLSELIKKEFTKDKFDKHLQSIFAKKILQGQVIISYLNSFSRKIDAHFFLSKEEIKKLQKEAEQSSGFAIFNRIKESKEKEAQEYIQEKYKRALTNYQDHVLSAVGSIACGVSQNTIQDKLNKLNEEINKNVSSN